MFKCVVHEKGHRTHDEFAECILLQVAAEKTQPFNRWEP